MAKTKTFWGTVDSFLTKIRKIFLNIITVIVFLFITIGILGSFGAMFEDEQTIDKEDKVLWFKPTGVVVDTSTAEACLLYTSPSPRDRSLSRMPSSA